MSFSRPPSSSRSPLSNRTILRHWQPPVAVAVSLLSACSPVGSPDGSREAATNSGRTPLPEFLGDPMERVNRGTWAVNSGLLTTVVKPTGRAYRAVVPTEARKSVNHFARNITYPGRLINNTLQGRWKGAGDESLRFLCNTTAGVGGFFDVASEWDIPKSDADFGQTFSRWGWNPGTFVMLPFFGPSDETHTAGLASDRLADPLTYIAPTPYTITNVVTGVNRLSDSSEAAARFVQSEADPYSGLKYVWSYAAKDEAPDWSVKGKKDQSTLQTLGVVGIRCQDPEFPARTREMSVQIPSTGRKLEFNCWIQPEHAPLVYINPGLGSHRLSPTNLSLAETLYQNGFSVVTTTSVFHPDFMEHASTADLPAYPPVDSHDLLVSLTEIDRKLEKKFSGRFGKRALVGCSMGAYQALYLAANEKKNPDLLHFDRHVAIDTPVNFTYGIGCLDRFYQAPSAWPAASRQDMVNNAVHKATKMTTLPPSEMKSPPFDGVESQFLIGMTFRLTLRDAIFSSQTRNNMGVLQTPLSKWKREPAYQEILGFSYRDYFNRFVLPYYNSKGIGTADFAREGNLKNLAGGLRSNPKVRVLVNQNDFLLAPGDISWLQSTIGSSRVKVFPDGGHLGNLATPAVQSALVGSLDGLR